MDSSTYKEFLENFSSVLSSIIASNKEQIFTHLTTIERLEGWLVDGNVNLEQLNNIEFSDNPAANDMLSLHMKYVNAMQGLHEMHIRQYKKMISDLESENERLMSLIDMASN